MVKKSGHPNFEKGNPGGPGRPVGMQNKIHRAIRELNKEHAVDVYKSVIAQAMNGCTASQKIILDRASPAARHREIEIDLPDDIKGSMDIIIAELQKGDLTIDEAQGLQAILEKKMTLEAYDVSKDLMDLKAKVESMG